ncbi:MAG: YegP family protein [Ectothiorhodospiraceae bacterium AqS1]|nr:YegP family protein [Ectothiorhodospiraceae bacterium AqS1]
MPGKFEIYKDNAGEFRYRLKAINGQIILTGEGYKTRASAIKGVESVRKNSQDPSRFEVNVSRSGKKFFNLTARNKQVIGTSQQYASDSGCKNGMKSVAKYAPDATIDDQTKS